MDFTPVRLTDYDRIYAYTSRFGEGSCQHSPVSMYSLAEKYGDAVCEYDSVLFTLRNKLCSSKYRVYLAPLGDARSMGTAYAKIAGDAAAYGKKACFFTLTQAQTKVLEEALPGRFTISEDRDLAEYFYSTEVMASFSGHALQRKRGEIHAFWAAYSSRASVVPIQPSDMAEVLDFEHKWLAGNAQTHDAEALERESRMIELQMAYFDALHLCGVIAYIDGRICGFTYGTKLCENVFDAIIEKGSREVPHLYKVLRQELAKQCACGCTYINIEEDLGVEGLRAMKLAYHPHHLLRKYRATEK
ncbi:MAG: DUF2156 domain-containing protein [Coriobacteriales bacterium]|nr:DUF2156 domain-containing protein [Coriobacteriales bacterium]